MAGNDYKELRLFVAVGNGEPVEHSWRELDVLAPLKAQASPLDPVAEVAFRQLTANKTANISTDVQKTIAQVSGNERLRNGINAGAQITGCPAEDYISLIANETSGGTHKKVETKEVRRPDGKLVKRSITSASGDFQITNDAYHEMLRRYGQQYMGQMQAHIIQQHDHSQKEGIRAAKVFENAIKHVTDIGPEGDRARAVLGHYKDDPTIQAILVGANRQALVAAGVDPKYYRLAHNYGIKGMNAVLAADPNARIDSVLNANALKHNKIEGGISVSAFLDEMVERPNKFTQEARAQLMPQPGAESVTPALSLVVPAWPQHFAQTVQPSIAPVR